MEMNILKKKKRKKTKLIVIKNVIKYRNKGKE